MGYIGAYLYLQLAMIYLGQENETRYYDLPIWIKQNKFKTKFVYDSLSNHSKTTFEPYSCMIRKGHEDWLDILTNIESDLCV